MGKVYVVHEYSSPIAAFSTKEKAALWIYESRNNNLQIEELVVDDLDPIYTNTKGNNNA